MADFDLSRLNILIVEDSTFMQTLLSRVLRNLDVKQLSVASDGSEAVHLIKQSNRNTGYSGNVRPISLVISDWMMSPVDGKMLLQWIRTHKDSPDPFLPFIMLSGMSEIDRVMEARALGANEFLAKPFSVQSIADKLASLIENPRRFVVTPNYFGPDRRRSQQPIGFDERRLATKEEIKTLHSPKVKTKFEDGIKAYYIPNPHDLRKITLGLSNQDGPGRVNAKHVAAAALELSEMENDYADWVTSSVEKLKASYASLKKSPVNYYKYFTQINTIAHELRGQGDTFGYPLISSFSKSLFDYTRIHLEKPDEDFFDLLFAHINLIQIVIRDKVQGSGGDIGKSLQEALNQAKQKYDKRTT